MKYFLKILLIKKINFLCVCIAFCLRVCCALYSQINCSLQIFISSFCQWYLIWSSFFLLFWYAWDIIVSIYILDFFPWMQFSPVGHYFASSSHDRTARVWSMDRIQPLRIMAGHLSDVDVSYYVLYPLLLVLVFSKFYAFRFIFSKTPLVLYILNYILISCSHITFDLIIHASV